MQLTTKQKFSLTFSIYVSVFVALIGAIFLLILHNMLIYQIQKDTATSGLSALKNHVAIKKDAIVIIPDQTGNQLADESIESNISVLILDADLKVIYGYGLLELYNQSDQESVKTIAGMVKNSQDSLKPAARLISWRGQNLSVYVAPIKNNGKIYGAVVTAKSLSQVQSLEQIIILTLFGLTISSILVSLALSRLLVDKTFKPIRSLTQIISAASLDKHNKTLIVSGNKTDDLVILGTKFNEMMTRLKSMSEQQKEFITNASHELKTPLSRAISSFDLLLSSDKKDKQTLKDIRNDLFEINNLLDKLMFLSKLQPGTILPSEKLSLNKLIKESAEKFLPEFNLRRLKIALDLNQDTTIVIPKEYMEVLLNNLLSNATKYSSENSTVTLRTRRLKQKVKLTIVNQGPGISKFDLYRIEKRFYRGAGGKKANGHGIGLSIVRRIADLYKIHFFIKSEKGKGTEATLIFPVF